MNKEENSSIAKIEQNAYLDVQKFEQIELLVERLKDSTLASQFIEKEYDKDEDGNIIESTERKVFNSGDMIMCLGLGAELGLSPWEALAYGKSLNLTSIKKIRKGAALGLDYVTSLEQIYVWGTGTKEIVYTSIHIVNTVLSRAGVMREILQDGKTPIYECISAINEKPVSYDVTKHHIIPKGMTPDDIVKVIDALASVGKIPIYKSTTPNYIAEVRLTRYNKILQEKEVVTMSYSIKEAIEAGLYKGFKADGTESKGKDNWNSHPATHLIKMCIMIGGRIIASDALQGIYIPEEITSIKSNIEAETTDFEEID